MKTLILFMAMSFVAAVATAEELFFPSKVGTVLIYKTFDKKNKETNTVKYTIKDVKTEGDNMDITYVCESTDEKNESVFKDELIVKKKGDKIYFDMSNLLNKAAFKQTGDVPADIQVTGNNLEVPANPKPGDVLPDATVTMAMNMGFMTMKMSAEVTNRKVESIETKTVKAGTFKCYKFSSNVQATTMGIKLKTSTLDWYAKGIGTVRTESYDKNGKLQSYTELTEIKQ
ncbi:MAG: hypothetical protein Q8914_06450 [Bacteroidota bacterium]|nr:hypothetical protein [Bacteroidota bacterium]